MVRQCCFKRAALVFFTLLFVVSAASISEAVFEGDMCWTYRITQTEDGPANEPILLKCHIKALDASTYIITGKVTVPSDNPAIFTGTATLMGTNIVMNLVLTQDHKVDWRDTGIIQMKIDAATLKGTAFGISQSFNRTTGLFDGEQDYASGTLTPRSCP